VSVRILERIISKTQKKVTLNKCYSVNTIFDTKPGILSQTTVFGNKCNGTTLPGTPSKKEYKSNLVDPKKKSKAKVFSRKGYCTNKNSRKKLITMNDTTKPKKETSGVLSFLRKNSKIKASKLNCAVRTKIELKSLNLNHEEVDDNYFSEALESQKSPANNTRCETTYENYLTKPGFSREDIYFDTQDYTNNSMQRIKYSTMTESGSPQRIFNRAVNINEIKKTNPELIRKSLQNFERSFRDILGNKSPKASEDDK
jgi:hypothetical protein